MNSLCYKKARVDTSACFAKMIVDVNNYFKYSNVIYYNTIKSCEVKTAVKLIY